MGKKINTQIHFTVLFSALTAKKNPLVIKYPQLLIGGFIQMLTVLIKIKFVSKMRSCLTHSI